MVYIFRVTNLNLSGRPKRSVSQGVYIFIPTEPSIRLSRMLQPGFSNVTALRFRHDSPYFHKYAFPQYFRTVSGIETVLVFYQDTSFINNIRSMEVNPFIRKLVAFLKKEGVFFSVREL